MNIGVLASHEGTTLQSLIDSCASGRIQAIRVHVENTDDYRTSEAAANMTLADLVSTAGSLVTAADAALPQFWKQGRVERRKTGFTIPRLRTLLNTRADELLSPWFPPAMKLVRASRRLKAAARTLKTLVDAQAVDVERTLSPGTIRSAFADAEQRRKDLAAAVNAYKAPAQRLGEVLNQILDAQSIIAGWQDHRHRH